MQKSLSGSTPRITRLALALAGLLLGRVALAAEFFETPAARPVPLPSNSAPAVLPAVLTVSALTPASAVSMPALEKPAFGAAALQPLPVAAGLAARLPPAAPVGADSPAEFSAAQARADSASKADRSAPAAEFDNPRQRAVVDEVRRAFSLEEADDAAGRADIERHLGRLTVGMQQLDREAGLDAFYERFNHWLGSSDKKKTGEEVKTFIENDMTNWPTHGQGHARQIAEAIVDTVGRLRRLGLLKLSDSDAAALQVYGAYLGMIHDVGNFRAPRTPQEAEQIRKSHDLVPAVLLFGGRIDGLEQQKQGFDHFLAQAAAEGSNPLIRLLNQVADDPLIEKRYAGDKDRRVATLLKEILLGSLSHGSLPGNPKLGVDALSSRRGAYIAQLKEGYPGQTAAARPDLLYKDADWERGMMAWASAEAAGLPDNRPLAALRNIFCLGEDLLNFADGNRARSAGILSGPGGTQLVPYNDRDSGKIRVFVVKSNPRTGRKLILEVGARQFGSLNVTAMEITGTDERGKARMEMRVLDNRFTPDSAGERDAAAQTGRVIGETFAYAIRALGADVLNDDIPQLDVVYLGAPSQTRGFHDKLRQAVSANLARIMVDNRELPPSVSAKDAPEYVNRYWRFVYKDRNRPKSDPAQDAFVAQAKRSPATSDEIELLSKRAPPIPQDAFKTGGWLRLKPNERFIAAGTGGGNTYVLVDGEVRGVPRAESGNPPFVVRASPENYSVFGGTVHMSGDEDAVRNASLFAGPQGAKVFVIPEREARIYLNAKMLVTPYEKIATALLRD